ncbi:hypothetical protein CFB47_38810 [Burkholderia sp. AU27893]|uniref:Uncharacterized protein n=2 Tax=Burkholderia cepacia complex TaxID=87882 RepID=A0A2S5DMW8_9BURK|nr:hypothetical protein [Burkholderia contaminans]OXI51854.1 hypothetical protein CFB47_38810 [Burkholderia sp. AU27893]POZ80459.1 hypothetical protein C3743_39200 [Burkholderia contaminans]RDS99258.1 hypothetical protein DWU95_36580 [Burkholderia contaminans]
MVRRHTRLGRGWRHLQHLQRRRALCRQNGSSRRSAAARYRWWPGWCRTDQGVLRAHTRRGSVRDAARRCTSARAARDRRRVLREGRPDHGEVIKEGQMTRVLETAEAGLIVLPEHDYQVLRRRGDDQYGF